MSKQNDGLSRRKMLKGSAAGALVAFGTGNATAKQNPKLTQAEEANLLQKYQNPRTVKDAVHQQSDVLEELVADGVLESASVSDLEELNTPTDGVGEEVTTYNPGDGHTVRIKVFRRVDAGYLSLSVFPEYDTAHAILTPVENGKPLSGDDLVKYGNLPEAEPQSCWLPGECWECTNCSEYCCQHDADGSCIQTCMDCNCSCRSCND